jgi:hypothetical protein
MSEEKCPKCGGEIISCGVVGTNAQNQEQEADWEECKSCGHVIDEPPVKEGEQVKGLDGAMLETLAERNLQLRNENIALKAQNRWLFDWNMSEENRDGVTCEFRDGRHYLYLDTGKFLWSGHPIWNAFTAYKQSKEMESLRAELAQKQKEIEGLRATTSSSL